MSVDFRIDAPLCGSISVFCPLKRNTSIKQHFSILQNTKTAVYLVLTVKLVFGIGSTEKWFASHNIGAQRLVVFNYSCNYSVARSADNICKFHVCYQHQPRRMVMRASCTQITFANTTDPPPTTHLL